MVSRPLALAIALCTIVTSCHRKERPTGALAPASGLPAAFTPVEWGPNSVGGESRPSGGASGAPVERCAMVLRDARDDTRLQLMRSHATTGSSQRGDTTVTLYGATGDYAVSPAGRYGVGARQWLRVECGSWRGLGIVGADR